MYWDLVASSSAALRGSANRNSVLLLNGQSLDSHVTNYGTRNEVRYRGRAHRPVGIRLELVRELLFGPCGKLPDLWQRISRRGMNTNDNR